MPPKMLQVKTCRDCWAIPEDLRKAIHPSGYPANCRVIGRGVNLDDPPPDDCPLEDAPEQPDESTSDPEPEPESGPLPTPWSVKVERSQVSILDADGATVMKLLKLQRTPQLLQHIVACVNAFAPTQQRADKQAAAARLEIREAQIGRAVRSLHGMIDLWDLDSPDVVRAHLRYIRSGLLED